MSYAKPLPLTASKPLTFLRDLTLVLLASFAIGLLAKASIPLPFTPVPLATQNTFILFLAVLLGARRAAAAVLAFLAQGALGLPVFAGGIGGLAKLVGPTGGYLFGYVAAAYIVGYLVERTRDKTVTKTFLALAAGTLVIYLFGASYLSTFIGLPKALLLGVAPFLLGDLLKIVFGLKLLSWLRR